MSNDPGGGPPGPGDRTIIKPRPGAGRAASGTPPPAPAVPSPPRAPSVPASLAGRAAPTPEAPPSPARFEFSAGGLDPLVQAAGPLLMLAGRLRHAAEVVDIGGLRRQLVAEVRNFEERARGAGVATDQIAAARYALCATLDEAITSTPWGARGEWGTQPLLSVFHRETWGGEKFFQLVDRTKSDPRQYAGLLEVLYVCMSLGFAGKFALDPQSALQRDNLQHELFERLRGVRGAAAEPLAAHWQGVRDKRNPLLRYVPWWVVAAAALALTTSGFLYFRFQLGQAAEPVLATLSQVGVRDFVADAPPTPAIPPAVTLRQLLADLGQQGLLTVEEQGSRSTVTLAGGDLFAPGSAAVNARFEPVLDRIAVALEEIPGPVLVIGHSDSQPIRSFKYQNNFELSADRAQSVVRRLEAGLAAAGRLQANGVGSTRPKYLPPDTAENRARNRRVEIVHVASADASP